MNQLQAYSKILGEIESAMDHVTAAFDVAHENKVPTEFEVLAIKNQLWQIYKQFDARYKAVSDYANTRAKR